MQIGIVTDAKKKIKNKDVLTSPDIPLPYIGIRRFLIPDPRFEIYLKNKILTVTEMMNFLRLKAQGLEIDGGCVIRPYFDYNVPIYYHPSALMSLMQGRMLHDSIKPQKITVLKELHLNGRMFDKNVSADIDFYDGERGIVYDLKTAKTVYMIPKPFHVVQLYLYSKILEQNGYKVNSGTIVYLSHSQMILTNFSALHYDATLSFEDVEKNLFPREKIDINEMREHYSNTVGNTMRYDYKKGEFYTDNAYWRCAYCPYRRYCPYAKANMHQYLLQLNPFTKYGKVSHRFITDFLNIKSAGVKEYDDFMYPEDELYDILSEIFENDVDMVVRMIKDARGVRRTPIQPMAFMEW